MHGDEDEFIHILEGAFRVNPRGTPHTWQNVSDAPARFFAGIMPAATAFEEFIARYAQLSTAERSTEAFARLGSETRAFEVIGPPLARCEPR